MVNCDCRLLLLLLTSSIHGSLQNFQYEYDYEYNQDDEGGSPFLTPEFVSIAQKLEVNLGDTVRLPCFVDRLDGYLLMWKKNHEILSVASQLINVRYRLEDGVNGNFLIIRQVNSDDIGVYTCALSSYYPTELQHSLAIKRACDCPDPRHSGNCSSDGLCQCKEAFQGAEDCSACAEGYYDYPDCKECPCFSSGTTEETNTDSGLPVCVVDDKIQCPCLKNFTGTFCDECAQGFHNFPNCVKSEGNYLPKLVFELGVSILIFFL